MEFFVLAERVRHSTCLSVELFCDVCCLPLFAQGGERGVSVVFSLDDPKWEAGFFDFFAGFLQNLSAAYAILTHLIRQ